MTEREKFEKWITEPPYEHTCERVGGWGSSGAYKRWETQLAWEAWQAARATPALPEGMAIVPVETQKDAERYNYVKSFMRTEDVGDDEVIWGLCIRGEALCESVIVNSIHDTIDAAIDRAMLAAAKEKGE